MDADRERKEAVNVAQQIVALDARYNAHRPLPHQHRMLYIRRRNQLLQAGARPGHSAPPLRPRYLALRKQLLEHKYGPLDKRNSRRSSAKHSLHQSVESLTLLDGHRITPQKRRAVTVGLVPTRSAQASRAMAGDSSLSEHYAFCGMHHIFDKHKDAVTVVQFANEDKTRLISASRDGTLSVFSLASEPPALLCSLTGHSSAVNDFDWSVANDFIVSASSDGTCRLWDSASGDCLRVILDVSGARTLCCRFHPQNNNLLVLGNSKALVRVFNISTGKAIKGGSGKTAGESQCLAFDSSGSLLWVGDSKGSIYRFELNIMSGKLQRSKRIVVSPAARVTSISHRTWVNREARDPSLLVSASDGHLRLFRLLPDGSVYVKRKFALPHTTQPIRSAFCPLMSFLQGACVVSGGEDGAVYFFDVESGALVNKLQGHSSPVIHVCWAYDESMLASCDTEGTVIVWKREQRTP